MKKRIAILFLVMLCGCSSGGQGNETVLPETVAEVTGSTPETSENITAETEQTSAETTENVSTVTSENVETSAEAPAEDTAEDERSAVLSAAERFPVIDKEWHEYNIFKCGLVPVRTDVGGEEKYGYADKNGNIVIKPQWDIVWEFSDRGVAVVGMKIGENEWNANIYRYGFIDINGNTLVEPVYDDVVVQDKNELDM